MDEEMMELLGQLEVDDELAGYDDYDDELLGHYDDDDDIGIDLGDGTELLGAHDDEYDDELGAFRLPRRIRRLIRKTPHARLIRGVRRRIRGRRRPSGRRRQITNRIMALQAKKANYINKIAPAIPGVIQPGARNFPLGFGSFTFVNAGPTQTNLTALPQKPFKGARLMVQVNRSAAAVAELVTITNLDVGTGNQLVSSDALPAEGFAATAFDTGLSLDPATPGIQIVLGIAISATPAVGQTISVSAMLIGNTIG